MRFCADKNKEWANGWQEVLRCTCSDKPQKEVKKPDELIKELKRVIDKETKGKKIGLFLSSGMDSIILASMLPKETICYTVDFGEGVNESEGAKKYAKMFGMKHKILKVCMDDFLKYSDALMAQCKSPLHACGVPLYMMALEAKKDGLDMVITACSADSRFLGHDLILSREWTLKEFDERYTFVKPELVLKNPVSIKPFYEKYVVDGKIDLQKFIVETQNCDYFYDCVELAGLELLNPFEYVCLNPKVWKEHRKILKKEKLPKPLVSDTFRNIFNEAPPRKMAFTRPMNADSYLGKWEGPTRPEFRTDIDMSKLTGDQKYLLFTLEQFLNLIEGK